MGMSVEEFKGFMKGRSVCGFLGELPSEEELYQGSQSVTITKARQLTFNELLQVKKQIFCKIEKRGMKKLEVMVEFLAEELRVEISIGRFRVIG